MKQLSADKMLNIIEYEKVRTEYRKDIIEYKKHRRIKIGPNLAIVFENERTLSFQIQEIMRAERIVHDEKIQEEIDLYNSIMPPKNGLSATLFIEVTQEDQIKPVLNQFIGLTTGKTIFLDFDAEKVFAQFEQGREEEDKISSVHYLQFKLDPSQVEKLADHNSKLKIGIEYNKYSYLVDLTNHTKESLYEDVSDSLLSN
ncbi:MAG: DUF3501 family protein [Candidatus Neomarinimicrobiota bacterium]|tara:strand:- start:142 stop:741 length:600 start_codon:yes stop_codon:yes gene_type:complete